MVSIVQTQRRIVSRIPSVALLVTALGITACDDDDDVIPPPPSAVVVATFRDNTTNFSQMQTFALADSVVQFIPATGTPLPVSHNFDTQILDRVRLNFLARGYVEEPNPENVAPDFIVLVGVTATQTHEAFTDYPWVEHYGFYEGLNWFDNPGFDDEWGIIYPWAPASGIASFNRGTIVVDLIPTLSVSPLNKTVQSAWAGTASAILNAAPTTTGINAVIDEMFILSPYLRSIP